MGCGKGERPSEIIATPPNTNAAPTSCNAEICSPKNAAPKNMVSTGPTLPIIDASLAPMRFNASAIIHTGTAVENTARHTL